MAVQSARAAVRLLASLIGPSPQLKQHAPSPRLAYFGLFLIDTFAQRPSFADHEMSFPALVSAINLRYNLPPHVVLRRIPLHPCLATGNGSRLLASSPETESDHGLLRNHRLSSMPTCSPLLALSTLSGLHLPSLQDS